MGFQVYLYQKFQRFLEICTRHPRNFSNLPTPLTEELWNHELRLSRFYMSHMRCLVQVHLICHKLWDFWFKCEFDIHDLLFEWYYVYMYIYICVYLFIFMYIYMCIWYTYIYIYVYIYMYIYIYIYIYIHTHTYLLWYIFLYIYINM